MLNYKTFMEEVKSHVMKMDETELADFIYELARVTKESQRMAFLQKFNSCCIVDRKTELDKVYNFCEAVENMEIHFNCVEYEEYGDGYWDRDWVYEYSDPMKIGTTLEEAFGLAENLVYEKLYKEAYELYDRLFSLVFSVYDEGAEEMLEGLNIIEAFKEKLFSFNLTKACSLTLHTAFKASSGNARIDSIYHIFQNEAFKEVPLESMFTVGPDPINEVEDFMVAFNSFLMTKIGNLQSRLLKETLPYIQKDALEIARESAAIHPGIYYELCKEALAEDKPEKAVQIGLDALNYVPKKFIIRSKTAYLTADAYKRLYDMEGYKKCLVEGFVSDSTPVNFLSLFTTCNKSEINEVCGIISNISKQIRSQYRFAPSELDENNLTDLDRQVIRLLNGEFAYAINKCDKDQGYLGWSDSFKGICIPLFLILIDKGNELSKAKSKVLEFVKRRLGLYSNSQHIVSFEEMIVGWKREMIMSDDQNLYLEWLLAEVDKRVDAVVGGGFRNSYHKGAEMIVYLGEVLESNGEKGAKQRLVEKYRKIHSRKRAFKNELNNLL